MYRIELSDVPTDKFAVRYMSGSIEGIAILSISKKLRKNIERAKLLADIGSGLIEGLNTISLHQKNHSHVIFLKPEVDFEALAGKIFFDEFIQWKKQAWYVSRILYRKRKTEMPIETVYVDLRNTGILLSAYPYTETPYITGYLFTAYIPYEDIGIS